MRSTTYNPRIQLINQTLVCIDVFFANSRWDEMVTCEISNSPPQSQLFWTSKSLRIDVTSTLPSHRHQTKLGHQGPGQTLIPHSRAPPRSLQLRRPENGASRQCHRPQTRQISHPRIPPPKTRFPPEFLTTNHYLCRPLLPTPSKQTTSSSSAVPAPLLPQPLNNSNV